MWLWHKILGNPTKILQDILSFFSNLKTVYEENTRKTEIRLHLITKTILIKWKPFFNEEWSKRIRVIQDLVNQIEQFLSFDELKANCFLHFYQVISAIPSLLLSKGKASENLHSEDEDIFMVEKVRESHQLMGLSHLRQEGVKEAIACEWTMINLSLIKVLCTYIIYNFDLFNPFA